MAAGDPQTEASETFSWPILILIRLNLNKIFPNNIYLKQLKIITGKGRKSSRYHTLRLDLVTLTNIKNTRVSADSGTFHRTCAAFTKRPALCNSYVPIN